MTSGVTGEVHGLDVNAAEVEGVAVGEPISVWPASEVELVDHLFGEVFLRLPGEAIHRHQAVQALGAWQVFVVDVHAGLPEEAVAWHVVFMAVAVQHRVHAHTRPSFGNNCYRGVDDHGFAQAFDQNGVARWISAVAVANQHRHLVGEPACSITP